MKHRNRVVTLLLLPAIIVLWFVGWSLYWIGSKRNTPRLQVTGNTCMERLRRVEPKQSFEAKEREKKC